MFNKEDEEKKEFLDDITRDINNISSDLIEASKQVDTILFSLNNLTNSFAKHELLLRLTKKTGSTISIMEKRMDEINANTKRVLKIKDDQQAQTYTPRLMQQITIDDVKLKIDACLIEMFPDEQNEAWIKYYDKEQIVFTSIERQKFQDFVRVQVYLTAGPKELWVKPLVNLYASNARRKPKKRLYLRSADVIGSWYYQINEQNCVRMTNGIIELLPSPTMFKLLNHQLPLEINLDVEPGQLDLLDKYTNFINQSESELFKTIICTYMIPGIAKPIHLTQGPPGSAKSTIGKLLKRIIDPSISMDRGIKFPAKEEDWFVMCMKHQLLFFDNLNNLSKQQQDDVCRIVTGTGLEKRKLYTDSESILGSFQGIIVMNGIQLDDLNSDFLDRCLINEVRRISNTKRINEIEFWQNFEKDLPLIRGAIFHVIAKAQAILPTLEHTDYKDFRLSDFAKHATSVALARGHDRDKFMEALKEKIDTQASETIEQSEVAEALIRFMENRDEWKGTAHDLLKELTEFQYGQIVGSGNYEKMQVGRTSKTWPQNHKVLGKELEKVAYLFPKYNLWVRKYRDMNSRTISIVKAKPKDLLDY
jgi:energy-coupling factor transporter ATP-binding protein EcfA2